MKVWNYIPTIRFPEFTENWNETKLGNIFIEIKSGKDKPNSEFGFPVYGSRGLLGYSDNFSYEGEHILIARVGANAGSLNFVDGKFSVTDNTIILNKNKQNNTKFFRYYLKYSKLEKMIFGSGQPLITGSQLKNLKIFIPSIEEQQKIASFLTAVDDKINALKRKHELLTEYKRGVMQKIFSQEIRFTDENGEAYPDWEYLKASDLFKNHSNKNHLGNLPILAITQDQGAVLRDEIDIDIKTSKKSVLSYKIVEDGDFIISLRSFQGGIEYSNITGICSPAYTVLKPIKEINDNYYKNYFKKEEFIRRLASTVIGIRDGKQISYSAFSTLKLPYPHLNEQKKIADFLDVIDKKLSFVSMKLNKMETYKKGLLQQMFV